MDARALLGRRTGIGVYTEQVARALASLPDIELTLFSPRPIDPRPPMPANVDFREDRWPSGALWVQARLAARAKKESCDVLLCALTIAPFSISIPVVPVVHDLTILSHPEWHRRKTVLAMRPWLKRSLEHGAQIVAVSRATARDVGNRFPRCRERIAVIENGVGEEFTPGRNLEGEFAIRDRYTRGRKYFLYFGTIEPRKNLETLVAACERLWSQDRPAPDLLLAGGIGWKSRELLSRIDASPFRERIHRAGYVGQEDAPALYRAAEAFCYPSLEEGFGLPVAEAMACGIPVVISDDPALLETAADACLSTPASNPEMLAAALRRALDDEPLRRELVVRGLARARALTWRACAEKTAGILARAARR